MPAWKTFDETTAAALKQRLDDASVSVESISCPLFDGGDSVVLAPTLQKGAAIVIIARRKSANLAVGESALALEPLAPPAGEITSVEISPDAMSAGDEPRSPAEPPLEITSTFAFESTATRQPEDASEFTFGPTTWERADGSEPLPEPAEFETFREARSSDSETSFLETSGRHPEIWDLPSEAPARSWHDAALNTAPVPPADNDRHYVATGFLGLDDYAEDAEEIARAKRPWWKKIFSD